MSLGPQLTGLIKTVPEDFLVEEIPAYLPGGSGEHLFLWVEKRDVPAEQLLKHVGRVFGLPAHEVGCAGLKDRRAVTRQWLSVPARFAERVDELTTERIRVLESALHANKLRTGHLRGNRFTLVVRDVVGVDPATLAETLQTITTRVASEGFPNAYGDQRFGRQGETLQLGLDLLTGRTTPKSIPYNRRKFLLKLALSAVQSDLFNQALAERQRDGILHTVLTGDVMQVIASGGLFLAEDAAVEEARRAQHETVVTGPIFGPKMRMPTGVPAEREQTLLERSGLVIDQFHEYRDLLPGTRRPYVIRPDDVIVTPHPMGWQFTFTLPAGVYATTCLQAWGDFRDAPFTPPPSSTAPENDPADPDTPPI